MKLAGKQLVTAILAILSCLGMMSKMAAQETNTSKFKVLAFYTTLKGGDQAHSSFVREANEWFPKAAKRNGFSYEVTGDWNQLNTANLSHYQVVLFLDTRPEKPEQRAAFQKYMENGGAWMGFHFAAFALTPSAIPQNWDWYHNVFLGSGEYKSNTWKPTAAVLRVEDTNSPAAKGLPPTFIAQPNEWYRWSHNLRTNADIKVLLSIDPASYPLGYGPKPHEIWHSGDYPVAWCNKNYRMVYVNMGHNDMDYDGHYNRESDGSVKSLSNTFANDRQNQFLINCLMVLGSGSKVAE